MLILTVIRKDLGVTELVYYPVLEKILEEKAKEKEQASVRFAYGCSFYKIVLLFLIGAFLGDIVETIFCRMTAGVG